MTTPAPPPHHRMGAIVQVGPIYHWSPRERLASIQRLGLMPGKQNISGPVYHNGKDDADGEFTQPGVCFATDPATAWNYSHGTWKTTGTFDLWQTTLTTDDEVHILPMWGPQVIEIRVHNRIHKRRLIWVGERSA